MGKDVYWPLGQVDQRNTLLSICDVRGENLSQRKSEGGLVWDHGWMRCTRLCVRP